MPLVFNNYGTVKTFGLKDSEYIILHIRIKIKGSFVFCTWDMYIKFTCQFCTCKVYIMLNILQYLFANTIFTCNSFHRVCLTRCVGYDAQIRYGHQSKDMDLTSKK